MKIISPKKYGDSIAWLLVLLIVIQNLFPVQTHTKEAITDSGRSILVCTLDGLKTLKIYNQESVSDQLYQQTNLLSPAIQFSELLFSSTTALNDFFLITVITTKVTLTNLFSLHLNLKHNSFQLIRAPPFFS